MVNNGKLLNRMKESKKEGGDMSEPEMLVTPPELIKAKREPEIIEVPTRVVMALDGAGAPESPEFSAAVSALYGIAYTLRSARKKAGKGVFKVGSLEGVWGAEPNSGSSAAGVGEAGLGPDAGDVGPSLSAGVLPPRHQWRWQLQMGVPPDTTPEELAAAVATATTKRGGKLEDNEEARRIRLLKTAPAHFVRVLHIGPYATESESFTKIERFLTANGLKREPWHIEVYISDPNRTAPEKLKTILLAKVGGRRCTQSELQVFPNSTLGVI